MLQNRYSEKKVSLLICPLISVSIVNSWSSILPERLFCIEFCMGILNLGKHTIEIFKKSDSLMSNLYKIKKSPFSTLWFAELWQMCTTLWLLWQSRYRTFSWLPVSSLMPFCSHIGIFIHILNNLVAFFFVVLMLVNQCHDLSPLKNGSMGCPQPQTIKCCCFPLFLEVWSLF